MITHRDLMGFPTATGAHHRAPGVAAPDEGETLERIADELSERSLERVLRVVLRLHTQASLADPATAAALLAAADELDAAVHAAHDVLFPHEAGSDPTGHPATETSPSPVRPGSDPPTQPALLGDVS